MKYTFVDPTASVVSDIGVIESNTGIEDTTKELPSVLGGALGNASRLSEGLSLITKIKDTQDSRLASLFDLDVMKNTSLTDLVDLSSVDMTSVFDLESLDFSKLGLPDPTEWDYDLSSIMDLSSVNMSDWGFPNIDLSSLKPDCLDLSDMYMSNLFDLSSFDMRGWSLPSFDFSSFGGEGGFEFPSWLNPANIGLGSMFDMSNIDLSGIIDLTSVGLPDWVHPSSWGIDWDLGSGGMFDSLKGIFDGMGGSGDLLGMGMLSDAWHGITCIGKSIADVLSPGSIIDAVRNFKIPSLDDIMDKGTGILSDLLGTDIDMEKIAAYLDTDGNKLFEGANKVFSVLGLDQPFDTDKTAAQNFEDAKNATLMAFGFLGDDWWYYDKARTKWDYDAVTAINISLAQYLSNDTKYNELIHASKGFTIYSDNAES